LAGTEYNLIGDDIDVMFEAVAMPHFTHDFNYSVRQTMKFWNGTAYQNFTWLDHIRYFRFADKKVIVAVKAEGAQAETYPQGGVWQGPWQ
jgi:hypothetical protein